ncbi:MAG: phospholipid carrier-dependent glycosyltransferase [Candidatus Altiarchaeota archaeon]|nr:phospholipid carrier-dependent glycosyltransferase [Candidatus Altiarchaeota archaeon]
MIFDFLWLSSLGILLLLVFQIIRLKLNKKDLIIFVLSFVFLFFVSPETRMYDEFIHSNAVQGVLDTGRPYLCGSYDLGHCNSWSIVWPSIFYGLAAFLSYFIGLFIGAGLTNLLLMSGAAVLIYRIGFLLSSDTAISVIAVLLLIFNPAVIRNTSSVFLDISYMFFLFLSIYFIIKIQKKDSQSWTGLIISISAFSLTKMEAPLISGIILIYSLLFLKPKKRDLISLIFGSIIILVSLSWSLNGYVDGIIFQDKMENIITQNLKFFINPFAQSPLLIIFFIFGVIEIFRTRKLRVLPVLGLSIFGIDAIVAEVPYMNFESTRYALRPLAAMIPVSILGIKRIKPFWPLFLLILTTPLVTQKMISPEHISFIQLVEAQYETLQDFSEDSAFVFKNAFALHEMFPDSTVCTYSRINKCKDSDIILICIETCDEILETVQNCKHYGLNTTVVDDGKKLEILQFRCI